MIDYPNLVPECNVDTAFVEMLGYRRPNHAYSITQVSKILENQLIKQVAIGFIDNDKKQPEYFKKFKGFKKSKNARLLKHPDRNHYLIVVNPAMDKFIYDLCKELNINLSAYGFPNEFKAFVSVTKKDAIKNSPQFKNLLNAIKQKKPQVLVTIKSWITSYSNYS